MKINEFLKSNLGKSVVSVILGFGLATLFYNSCKDEKCLRFVGPPPDEIKGKVFRFDDKCYRYKQIARKCNSNKKKVKFADTYEKNT